MSEVLPAAREALRTLAAAPLTPVKLLVVGGIGTGKTGTLAAIRQTLQSAGVPVRSTVQSGTHATVIDDADLLDDAALQALTARAEDPEATLVIAAQPREQRAALRTLFTALERERPRLTLGALTRVEVARILDSHDPESVSAIAAASAGLPFLVDAARSSAGPEQSVKAAQFALLERLRRVDDGLLDALLIMSLSPGLGATDLAAALTVDIADARDLVDRCYATGLLDPGLGPRFHNSLHRAVAQISGAGRHQEVETAVLRTQLESSTLTRELALRLAEHGMTEPGLASVLTDAARRPGIAPVDAARLYRAAMTAGEQSGEVAIELADTLAVVGDCAGAAALADAQLGSTDPGVRAAAVRIAAAVATHDGNSGQAAELFGWLAPENPENPENRQTTTAAPAALVLLATGDAQAARDALAIPPSGPPVSAARAARNLAEGLLATLERPYPEAMAKLGQAFTTPTPGQRVHQAVPDSPTAVVALAALHSGDPVRARSVLGRAVRAADADPDPVFDHRHRLLSGWLKMQDGQLVAAAADVTAVPESGLHRRDALWRAALQTGLARRNGDSGALQLHWYAAMEVLAEYSLDLFSLLPLGELWVAAARIRQEQRLTHHVEQAFALLTRLGNPSAWTLPLHWAGVHAAILAQAPETMAPHGQALSAAATDSGFARALASAGRAWLRVLASQVEFDEVAAAARGLAQFGLTWDATRLAGQAALQSADTRVSAAMLQVARDLKLTGGQDLPAETEPSAAVGPSAPAPSGPSASAAGKAALSEREREVAELLLLGMPYRDIGSQLFISAKTVEHHVARIRRRLGAESRSEMLSMLRAMLAPQA